MPTRRHLLGTGAALALAGCAGGGPPTATPGPSPTESASLALSAAAFDDGGQLPVRFSCDGEGVSPPLSIADVPDAAALLFLVVDDPDAPRAKPFVHWLLWNLGPDRVEIPEGVPAKEQVLDGARQGTTSAGKLGYFPACPPRADGPHTYRFTLLALDAAPEVAAGAKRPELETAIEGSVVALARLRAMYDRG